jgi:hypothetical protein
MGAALERLAKRLRIGMIGPGDRDARNDYACSESRLGCARECRGRNTAIARFVSPKTNEEDAVANILLNM